MNCLRKTFLLISGLSILSVSALAIKCTCVTLGKDTCGGCADSYCATLFAASVGSSHLPGWDQMLPGFWQKASANHAVAVRRGGTTLTIEVSPIRLSALLQRSVPPAVQNVALGTGGTRLPQWSPFLSGLVLSSSSKGATVVSVLPGSSAAENGIRPGDTILSSDGVATADLSQFEGADYRADLALRVAGRSGERTVRLTMSSVADILHTLSHSGGKRLSFSQGF